MCIQENFKEYQVLIFSRKSARQSKRIFTARNEVAAR